VTSQRNAEWRHSVRRPCDTMRIRRRAYGNTIMLIRSSVLYGTMYRVASICFCIFQRCTSHRTMHMTYYTTYTWIWHDSVKAGYDICRNYFDYRRNKPLEEKKIGLQTDCTSQHSTFRIVYELRTETRRIFKFYIFLTVHLCIILVGDQLDAQFLL